MRRVQQVAAICVLGRASGGGAPTTSSFVMPAANFDTRSRAFRSGQYGSSYALAYVANATDYWWCSHNDGTGRFVNPDPGDFAAALAGKTGHETQLAAGNRTAAQVGAAIRAAHGLGGSGATVTFPGTCSTGTAIANAGTAGMWGNRQETPQSRGNPITIPLGQHFTGPAAAALASGWDLNLDGDGTEPVNVAVYIGGSAADPNGATLAISYTVTPNGPGWYTYVPTAAEAFALSSSASVRLIVNASPGNTTSYPGFNQNGPSDLTDQNLELYAATAVDGGFDNSAPWPATLSGRSFVNPFGLRLMLRMEYRTAPFGSDASRRGYLGVHTDDVFSGQQSDLRGIDPAGANVYTGITLPTLIGMLADREEVAIGDTHDVGAQFRLPHYNGGSIGDASGATLATDPGQTSGTATQQWVGVDVVGDVALPSGGVIQLDTRGDGGLTIRFGPGGSPELASPNYDPADFDGSAEFETNSGSTNSTNDAVAAEATVDGTGGVNPGNLPGRRIRWRTPGIVAA